MEPYNISNYRLAKTIGMSETAVGQIVNGKRAITVRTAFLLSRAFGTTPEFWLNLQRDYDLLSFDASSIGETKSLI